jgi:hypothetical protein
LKYLHKVIFVICLISSGLQAQITNPRFELVNDVSSTKIPFDLINNLIIVPVYVNGTELNFILDTGVQFNIIFNTKITEVLEVNDARRLELRGLGQDGFVEAIYSKNNILDLGNIKGYEQDLFIITDRSYDLSTKLGVNVHGVLGYEIFKDFLVELDYVNKKVHFSKHSTKSERKLKRFESFDLTFNKKKPFIDAQIQPWSEDSKIDVHLLIDSGGGDAIWLFEDADQGINPPNYYFHQFMGQGLSGRIYGKKSKVNRLELGVFEFDQPNASYPDSLSIGNARSYKERNGSLGGEVLKRFKVVFDYKNEKVYLKKNKFYKSPFRYNHSGMEIVFDGHIQVNSVNSKISDFLNSVSSSTSKTLVFESLLEYSFKPLYKIYQVAEDSPAARAGLRPEDRLVSINGDYCYDMSLQEINYKFSEIGETVNMTVSRTLSPNNTIELKFKIKIQDRMFEELLD